MWSTFYSYSLSLAFMQAYISSQFVTSLHVVYILQLQFVTCPGSFQLVFSQYNYRKTGLSIKIKIQDYFELAKEIVLSRNPREETEKAFNLMSEDVSFSNLKQFPISYFSRAKSAHASSAKPSKPWVRLSPRRRFWPW